MDQPRITASNFRALTSPKKIVQSSSRTLTSMPCFRNSSWTTSATLLRVVFPELITLQLLSVAIGNYYRQKRNVPATNVLTLAIPLSDPNLGVGSQETNFSTRTAIGVDDAHHR